MTADAKFFKLTLTQHDALVHVLDFAIGQCSPNSGCVDAEGFARSFTIRRVRELRNIFDPPNETIRKRK